MSFTVVVSFVLPSLVFSVSSAFACVSSSGSVCETSSTEGLKLPSDHRHVMRANCYIYKCTCIYPSACIHCATVYTLDAIKMKKMYIINDRFKPHVLD